MKLSSIVPTIQQFFLNMKACRNLPKIPLRIEVNDGLYMSYGTRKEVKKIYREQGFSIPFLLITLAFRKKLCFVLRDKDDNFLATCCYYFNINEYKIGFIHFSYHYTELSERGKGYGQIISIASEEYIDKFYPLKGIRTRVLQSNIASMRCRVVSGYKIIEEIPLQNGEIQNYLERIKTNSSKND